MRGQHGRWPMSVIDHRMPLSIICSAKFCPIRSALCGSRKLRCWLGFARTVRKYGSGSALTRVRSGFAIGTGIVAEENAKPACETRWNASARPYVPMSRGEPRDMTSNDADRVPGGEPAILPPRRCDETGSATKRRRHPRPALAQSRRCGMGPDRARLVGRLGGTMLVFSAFPIANLFSAFPPRTTACGTRWAWPCDRGWMSTPGPRAAGSFRSCILPPPRRCLRWVSMLGRTGSLLALVLVNSAAWLASIVLSVWLAVKPGRRRYTRWS